MILLSFRAKEKNICVIVIMYRLTLLLLVATLAVGQDLSAVSGRGGKVKWVECLEGIKESQEVENAKEICNEVVEKQLKKVLRNYTNNIPTFEMITELQAQKSEILSNCLVQRLGLIAEDGSLDAKKLLEENDKIQSEDLIERSAMMYIGKVCLGYLGNETSAVKQLQSYMMCVMEWKDDYCDQHGILLETYLARKTNPSACASVQWPTDVNLMTVSEECQAEFEANKPKDTQQENSSNNVGGEQDNGIMERVRRIKNTMLESLESKQFMEHCVSKKLGHYSPETGYNLTAFKHFLGNLPGWEPEVLANVTDAFDMCILEGVKYDYCMNSKIIDICGFGNVVTSILRPFIDEDMEKGAFKYAQKVIGVEDLFNGDDDDSDIDDDYNDIDDDDDSNEMMDGVTTYVVANIGTSRRQWRAENSEDSEEEEEDDDSSESEDR